MSPRKIGDLQFDWFTIGVHRPLLFKNKSYRISVLKIILQSLPQTKEVLEAENKIVFGVIGDKYEERFPILGVRLTAGKSMVRLEFQGMAFTRTSGMYNVVINTYYKIWKKISIIKNGIEYEPPVITSLHVCKDIVGTDVENVLPLPSCQDYEFRFKKRYKPIFRDCGKMEGYHIGSGKYLLKAYRKDWEVLDKSNKNPIKYKYQKKYYGKYLQGSIVRVELEVSGERQCRWVTNILLEVFRKASKENKKRVALNRNIILQGILNKYYQRHRVVNVENKRRRDWSVEKRWSNFFSGKIENYNCKKHSSIETSAKSTTEVEKYLRIAIKKSILCGLEKDRLKITLESLYSEIMKEISSDCRLDQEVLEKIGQEILKEILSSASETK